MVRERIEIVIINKRVYSKKFIDSLNKYLKTNNNHENRN